jgi:uncharacterized SAM-dependent methyltransferase
VHPSQFPSAVRRDLLESLRARQVNHKFHYDSYKQTQKWLALHEAYSPARTDAECQATYSRAFAGAIARLPDQPVHLVGLGCGGGQKDLTLLQHLRASGKSILYTASDVSTPMVLVAVQAVKAAIPGQECAPLVCDLASVPDWGAMLHTPEAGARLITFLGMLPNFEPTQVLGQLSSALRSGDFLLVSANLAPGPDYEAGVKRILPLYANALTEDWLLTFLMDLGVERGEGQLRFRIERSEETGMLRIAAHFTFKRARSLRVDGEVFEFRAGERIRLFFSYRHTPGRVAGLLAAHGISVLEQWITPSGEEGVFLAQKVETR